MSDDRAGTRTMDIRFKPVVRQIAKTFALPAFEVEEALTAEAYLALIHDFLSVTGPRKLFICRRNTEAAGPSDPGDMDGDQLVLTTGESDRIAGKVVLVVKLSDQELTTSNIETEVLVGVMQGSPIKTLLATLQHVYMPSLQQRTSDWGAKLPAESSDEFLGSVSKFVEMLGEAVSSLESGLELAKPDPKYDVENKQPAFNRAASQPELVVSFEGVVEAWCLAVEELLAENDQSRAASADDVGPATELECARAPLLALPAAASALARACKCCTPRTQAPPISPPVASARRFSPSLQPRPSLPLLATGIGGIGWASSTRSRSSCAARTARWLPPPPLPLVSARMRRSRLRACHTARGRCTRRPRRCSRSPSPALGHCCAEAVEYRGIICQPQPRSCSTQSHAAHAPCAASRREPAASRISAVPA